MSARTGAEYLELYRGLPDLLALAIERDSSQCYAIQDDLRQEYRALRRAFRWSMLLRCFSKCSLCRERFTQVIYELENPFSYTIVKTDSSHLHAVEKHGAKMKPEIQTFLDGLNTVHS